MSTAESSDLDEQSLDSLAISPNRGTERRDRPPRFSEANGSQDGLLPRTYNKKHHASRRRAEDSPASYLIIHRVSCSKPRVFGEDHEDHATKADYLDVPRLFANDTRGSALRGTEPILDLEEYYENHPEICMTVYKSYSCSAYHRRLKDSFQLIATGMERQVFNRLRPWFFQLPETGPPAQVKSESITLNSETLSAAMTKVVASDGNQLADWRENEDLQAPYDYFYHYRQRIRAQSKSVLDRARMEELAMLLDYIDQNCGGEFDKIDNVFKLGAVRLEYFSKLFAPRDVVVTFQDGTPRAYVVERASLVHGSFQLECWTWEFDGSFRKKDRLISVLWPAYDEETVSIDSLAAWPLRLDSSNLEDRLLKRGKEFWTCRHKRFVSYNAPIQTIFEMQTVRGFVDCVHNCWQAWRGGDRGDAASRILSDD